MRKLKEYDISFAGLKQGSHQFDYHIDKHFLELFAFDEVNDIDQTVTVLLEKKSNLMELHFSSKGTVNVNCDLSNEPFDLAVSGTLFLVVKFGEEYNDEDEELLILPQGEHQLNVAQYIYELIVLSIPAKRVHPDVLSGKMHSEVLDRLEALAPKEYHPTETVDPRWESLKNLITDK
ncbi:hypothetical protein CGC53_02685 [Capnocytophaga leadbetteri]|jgi:hypothetical protein|uniref:DNA-binding protein n=1 Tax=Capnocytophaga leadbetteri TaxID=327575 RepID=A0A250F875_9FLAO|nr:DUF177 domain-containing protein [Capnocytophaga sp.]ATA81333.1 hypothetical protein CGC53_02685 [Capnocytophaga leadbetteri]MBB1569182.1 DUF177 domain-containing protein [Capnocytophaga sp.]